MIILGIGSNEGNRMQYIASAVQEISKSVLVAVQLSPIYESEAVLKPNSSKNWRKPFLNMAVSGETHLSPSELLKTIKMLEKKLGRQERETWAPREIDIDILAYNNLSLQTDTLTIPHKELCRRPFALLPLANLAPNWQYPAEGAFKGRTAYEISQQLFDETTNITIIKEPLPLTPSEIPA